MKKISLMAVMLVLSLFLQHCSTRTDSASSARHREKIEKISHFLETGHIKKARALFQEIEKNIPKDGRYFEMMFQLAVRETDPDLRWLYSHRLLKAAAQHQFLRTRRGWLYANLAGVEKAKGRPDRAEATLENALKHPLDPESKRAVVSYLKPLRKLNQTAPPVNIEIWLNTPALSGEALREKILVIDFWSPACAPCRDLFPRLQAISDRHHHQDLVILAITRHSKRYSDDRHHKLNVSLNRERELLTDFLQRHRITLPVGVVTDQTLMNDFGVMGYPTLFLISSDGIITDFEVGAFQFEAFSKKIEALLSEPKANQ